MFVEHPNLPNNVSAVLVDPRTPENIVKKIEEMGITCLKAAILEEVHPALVGHADMQLAHTGGNTFVCEPRLLPYYRDLFRGMKIRLLAGESVAARNYPADVAYNVVSVGAYAFHLPQATDAVVRREIERRGATWNAVKQGYSKCSVCVVSENALITGDVGIARKARACGLEVLQIDTEQIRLPGLDMGFIGGASGKLKRDLLAFTGDIRRLECGEAIERFCGAQGVRTICLSEGEVLDIGSIIPIAERT